MRHDRWWQALLRWLALQPGDRTGRLRSRSGSSRSPWRGSTRPSRPGSSPVSSPGHPPPAPAPASPPRRPRSQAGRGRSAQSPTYNGYRFSRNKFARFVGTGYPSASPSSAVEPTQKSVARPATTSSVLPSTRRASPVSPENWSRVVTHIATEFTVWHAGQIIVKAQVRYV